MSERLLHLGQLQSIGQVSARPLQHAPGKIALSPQAAGDGIRIVKEHEQVVDLLDDSQEILALSRSPGTNEVQNMTAQLAGNVSQAPQIVNRLYPHLFGSQDLMPGSDGIDISRFCILLLSSIHKSGIAHILVILQNFLNPLQAKGRLFHVPLR